MAIDGSGSLGIGTGSSFTTGSVLGIGGEATTLLVLATGGGYIGTFHTDGLPTGGNEPTCINGFIESVKGCGSGGGNGGAGSTVLLGTTVFLSTNGLLASFGTSILSGAKIKGRIFQYFSN